MGFNLMCPNIALQAKKARVTYAQFTRPFHFILWPWLTFLQRYGVNYKNEINNSYYCISIYEQQAFVVPYYNAT